jgi:hypothetical protein
MSKTTIPTGGITADAIDATLIADDAISEEHLDATAITGHTALAEEPADTDEFLISDGGTLKRIDASYVGGGNLVKLTQAYSTTDTGSLNVDSIFTSAYTAYRLVLVAKPVNSDVHLTFRWRDGGSDLSVGQYYASARGGYVNGSGAGAQSFSDWAQSTTKLADSVNNNNYNGFNIDALLRPYNNTGVGNYSSVDNTSTIIWHCNYWADASPERQEQVSGGSTYTQTSVPDGFTISFSSGDIDSYSYSVFGYKG